METVDKINIYVPARIGTMLSGDAELFEVFKKDGHTTNMNKFLCALVVGYLDDYRDEESIARDRILAAIGTTELPDAEKVRIAEDILQNVVLPTVPPRKGKNPIKLSLKPRKSIEAVFEQVLVDLGDQNFISQYFCKMFLSYCDKPICKREQIIFREKYDLLQAACAAKRCVVFRTIWNKQMIHEVVPYKIVTGPEEMFNYLLCAEIDRETQTQEARTYRLNRIDQVFYGRSSISIDEEVRNDLDTMQEKGPQYVIHGIENTCVKLSAEGENSYTKIYFGRPKVDRIESHDGYSFYYFSCSYDQLFMYFKRFEGGSAEILYPQGLRDRMIQFHKESLNIYEGENSNGQSDRVVSSKSGTQG